MLLAAKVAPAQAPARQLREALDQLRVDRAHIYFVRDFDLRPEGVRLSFIEGKLAMLEQHDGRILGAVFTGHGRVLARPRDPVERLSLLRFTGAPLLDLEFTRAYLRFTDDTGRQLRNQLATRTARKLSEPTFADEWDLVVANLNPWQSLRALQDLLSAEPKPYFYAALTNPELGAFDLLLDSRREEHVLAGQPNWLRGVRYYDAWTSFTPQEAHRLPWPAFVPLHYEIEATIERDLAFSGRARVRLRAAANGERVVELQLARQLRVEQVTDEAGTPLEFFQSEPLGPDEFVAGSNLLLYIVLPEQVPAGAEFIVQIAYRGKVIRDTGTGVFAVEECVNWYPGAAGGRQFSSYDLRFRWPRHLTLVATGTPGKISEDGAWRAGRWQSRAPLPRAGFHLGELESEEFESGRWKLEVHAPKNPGQTLARRATSTGTAPAAAIGSGGQPTPERTTAQQAAEGPAAPRKEIAGMIASAIEFYEELLGPFPFDRLAVTQATGDARNCWPGLLNLAGPFDSSVSGSPAGSFTGWNEAPVELALFRRLAHQWLGNAVAAASYRDEWLLAGLANYVALMYLDARNPAAGVLASWLEAYREELTAIPAGAWRPVEAVGPLLLGWRLRSSKAPNAYRTILYGKGTWVWHMLRMMLRAPEAEEPDLRFVELLRVLVSGKASPASSRGADRTISTADLQRELEQRMTPAMNLDGDDSMEWFFDQWVRGTGIPAYSLDYQPQRLGAAVRVRGTLRQRGVGSIFLASVPLYADTGSGEPGLLGTVIAVEPDTPFEFPAHVSPRRILIDPHRTLLCSKKD